MVVSMRPIPEDQVDLVRIEREGAEARLQQDAGEAPALKVGWLFQTREIAERGIEINQLRQCMGDGAGTGLARRANDQGHARVAFKIGVFNPG